jgi:iron complex transport system substrate-binding protein
MTPVKQLHRIQRRSAGAARLSTLTHTLAKRCRNKTNIPRLAMIFILICLLALSACAAEKLPDGDSDGGSPQQAKDISTAGSPQDSEDISSTGSPQQAEDGDAGSARMKNGEAKDAPKRVVACSGSFAQVWLLAGGKILATTRDAFDNGFLKEGEAEDVGGVNDPNLEQILSLSPDLILLSADIPGHVRLQDPLTRAGVKVLSFSVESFDQYLQMLSTCTGLTGRNDLYQENGLRIRKDVDAIVKKAEGRAAPRVLLLRANSGKVAARDSETMAGKMLKDLGCVNIADGSGLPDTLSMEIILREDPDYIFAVTQGSSEADAKKALKEILTSDPAWKTLRAVRKNQYILLPKDLFHLKPNRRWAESYEYLWKALYGK